MPMARVIRVLAADHGRPSSDSILLAPTQRHLQRETLVSMKGTRCVLELAEAAWLRSGDAFELDDGTIVELIAEPEPLLEVRGSDVTHLARIAWHLGDRHLPLQVFPNRLRVRPEPATRALLDRLSARVVE